MTRRFFAKGLCAAMLVSCLFGGRAMAQDAAAIGGGPRVFSIQPRAHRLGHEFQLGVGALPLDAFYIGVVAGASYTYHFSDFWAWEIAGAGYSLNFDTSLEPDLYSDYGVRPVNHGGERIHVLGATSLVVKPLFGKLAIFNRGVIASETFFSLGLGGVLLGKYPRPALSLGAGMRFWSTDTISLRVDIRDHLIFTSLMPKQALFVMLSASFNFVNNQRVAASEVQR